MRTQVPTPGEAVPAVPADDVSLAANDLAGEEVLDLRSDLDDLADELMPHDHRHRDRLLRPRVPIVDMDIGPADAGAVDLDQAIGRPHIGHRHVFEPQTDLRVLLDEGFHGEFSIFVA